MRCQWTRVSVNMKPMILRLIGWRGWRKDRTLFCSSPLKNCQCMSQNTTQCGGANAQVLWLLSVSIYRIYSTLYKGGISVINLYVPVAQCFHR